MLQVKCIQGGFFNNPLRQQSVEIAHGARVVTGDMSEWTYHTTTVENCSNIETQGLKAGFAESHDEIKRQESGKGKRRNWDKSRGRRQDVYHQLPMDRATEQRSLDKSHITFDGSKPSFYKPYEPTTPTAGMIVVSIYHRRHYDEEVHKRIGERQLSLMSSAGALTTGNVDKKNIGAFFQYRQTNDWNHVTKSLWNLVLLKKLNPEDEAMHSTFDYVNLERNRYDYTKE